MHGTIPITQANFAAANITHLNGWVGPVALTAELLPFPQSDTSSREMFRYSLPVYTKYIMFAVWASLVLLCADALSSPPILDLSLVVDIQDPAMLHLALERPSDFVEGDLLDNDPYSDGEFDGRIWVHIDVSHTLTEVDDDDCVEVNILHNPYMAEYLIFPKVVIPSCPRVTFRPHAYNRSAVRGYINLWNPTGKVFQPAYGVHQYDPSRGSYGREYIYEVQMSQSTCEETFNSHLNLIF